MNFMINEDILWYCKENGLEPIGTGGGCDYMCKSELYFDSLIACAEDRDFPLGLGSRCVISCFYNPQGSWDGEAYAAKEFKTVMAAVRFLNSADRFDLYIEALESHHAAAQKEIEAAKDKEVLK